MESKYTEINSKTFDKWNKEGWEWWQPIIHEVFERAKTGDWSMVLTPTKPVPKDWFCDMKDAKTLGLASGGGQLQAGFILTDIYQDTNGSGNLHEFNIPSFYATRAVKK